MAIFIGLKLQNAEGATLTYSFFTSDGRPYGLIAVDTVTREIVLIDAKDEHAEKFAFPRAQRAIQMAWDSGDLPSKLCYSA